MERTTRGKKKTAAIGRLPVGSDLGLYGYRYHWSGGKPKLVGRTILPDEAAVVRQIFDLCISSICVYEIARTLNLKGIPTKGGGKWHPLTVKRLLINTGYKGVTYYGKERSQKLKTLPNVYERPQTPANGSLWKVSPHPSYLKPPSN